MSTQTTDGNPFERDSIDRILAVLREIQQRIDEMQLAPQIGARLDHVICDIAAINDK